MKYVLVLLIALSSLCSKGQQCYNIEISSNKTLVDSLKKEYVDPSGTEKKDSLLRAEIFDYPLFYDAAVMYGTLDFSKYLRAQKSNIDVVFSEFYFNKNGQLDFFAYELMPIDGKKITEADHRLVCSYLENNKVALELTSTKPFLFEISIILPPAKSIQGKN